LLIKGMKIAMIIPDNRDEFRKFDDPVPYFGPAPSALLEGLAGNQDCEVHIVSCVHRTMTAPEKIAGNIYYHAVGVGKWGWLRGGYLGCIRAIRRQLQKIQPDIVHGQGTERYCAISAVSSGFPNVLTIHGNMKAIAEIYGAQFGSFHWLTARLETFTLARTAGVFCNSAYTESLVKPRTKKIWRVANALQPEFFKPRPVPPPATRPVFLNVGMMEPRKQQLELLGVARKWHERGFKFELRFVGNRAEQTDYGRTFLRELAAAESAGYARHLGLQSVTQIIETMDAASALIHFPSEEAFGLVVAEALARNLKFFGAATGGVVDIAGGVQGAELVPAQDWAALENAIARWLTADCPPPPDTAAIMRERYHPTVIARRHLEIYREVIQERSAKS
jgi:glycosyltransferase involved in cell wall biosynthesis